jgi:hypothetical protein
MQSLKRNAVLVAMLILVTATPTLAADTGFTSFAKDVLYGGLSGGLVGATVMLFAKKPSKHLDFIAYGAAGGVAAGATYGAVSMGRSLAEVEDGDVKFSMPTITPEFRESSRSRTNIVAVAQLLRGKF